MVGIEWEVWYLQVAMVYSVEESRLYLCICIMFYKWIVSGKKMFSSNYHKTYISEMEKTWKRVVIILELKREEKINRILYDNFWRRISDAFFFSPLWQYLINTYSKKLNHEFYKLLCGNCRIIDTKLVSSYAIPVTKIEVFDDTDLARWKILSFGC